MVTEGSKVEFEYTPLPDRAVVTVKEEADKDAEIDANLVRFRDVGPRTANDEGDVEFLDGVPVTHRFVESPGDSELLKWHYVEAGEGEPS